MAKRIGWLALFATILAANSTHAQTPAPCDALCTQAKVAALMQHLAATRSREQPAPSNTPACASYAGNDSRDPLLDVCAKLKHTRSHAWSAQHMFGCPASMSGVSGVSADRIVALWGLPDVAYPADDHEPITWTYALNKGRPNTAGGDVAQITLRFNNGRQVSTAICSRTK